MRFIYSKDPVDYQESLEKMLGFVEMRKNVIWGLEHNHVYTAGTSANDRDLLTNDFEVIQTNRGGKHTYHGPGQLIIYIMYDLTEKTLSWFIESVLSWGVKVCNEFGLSSKTYKDKIGIWIDDRKIMSVGIRVSKKMTYHGLAFNVNTDLSKFDYIIPCGLSGYKMTSFSNEGVKTSVKEVFDAFKSSCPI